MFETRRSLTLTAILSDVLSRRVTTAELGTALRK